MTKTSNILYTLKSYTGRRKSSFSYCLEAKLLFARMSNQPSVERKKLIDKTIIDLKTAGIWSKLDVLYFFAANDLQSALLNWLGTSYNATAINSPIFTSNVGIKSDGVTAYLKTSYIPSSSLKLTVNDASMGCYIYENIESSNYDFSSVDGTNYTSLRCRSVGNILRGRINGINSDYITPNSDSIGFWMLNRVIAPSFSIYKNGSLLTSQSYASVGSPTLEMYVLNGNHGSTLTPSPRGQKMFFAGASLNAAEISAFNTIINYYFSKL